MSQWQQHYYTWSTKSLSGNKVGLGIVAASNTDRDYLRLAGTEAAKCEPCRSENALMVERMKYSAELKGFVRTGTIPSEQGADHRNNKFVHVFSSVWKDFSYPEDYLCSLPYETNWNGQKTLEPVNLREDRRGRKLALSIVNRYGLEKQLPVLFYDAYHCLLTAEKPLLIVDSSRKAKEFGNFAKNFMILIHYLLPESLRKDADYVSFVTEMTQEAHFLFANQQLGKYGFSVSGNEKKREYVLLEKEFFDHLAQAFMKEDDSFEKLLSQINQVLEGLADKRNQLEKCIYTLMAPYAGKQKEKEDFFSSMEKLMYWARKDQNLIKPLEDSIKELDFLQMDEEQLYSYTKLMLTGAGGGTKEFVFRQLNRMLSHYFEHDKDCFWNLIIFIRENHGSLYEELLMAGDRDGGFTNDILFTPISDVSSLECAVKYHKNFFKQSEYRDYLVENAYSLFRLAQKEENRNKIQSLGKNVDEEAFVQLKKKDVELVVKHATNLAEFLSILKQMNLESLEHPILAFLFRRAVSFLKQEAQLNSEEEAILQNFAEVSDTIKEMEKEIAKCHERGLTVSVNNLTPKNMIDTFFMEKNNRAFVKSQSIHSEGTESYHKVKNKLLAKRYCVLVKEQGEAFYSLETRNWIRFVLKLSGMIENRNLAQSMIQETKKLIIKKSDLALLANVNHTLKNYGTATIHCPETLWDNIKLENEEDFQVLYETIDDISLVRCDKSENYRKAKILYEFADAYKGETEEKAVYAWQQYRKKNRKNGDDGMEENKWKKLLSFAIDDILSKSIWAVLLGFYGFLFVTIREEIGIMPGYNPSVVILILLVLIYAVKSFMGSRRQETPGSIIYVMGVGILLMNWGLALDTTIGIGVLYIVTIVLAIGAKVFHHIFFGKQKDER